MNEMVTDYINKAPDEQKRIMNIIRQLIHENVKKVQEEFKWSRPVFGKEKDFAYLKTAKAVESARGASPRAAHRTVLDSLPSHGSCYTNLCVSLRES
jgi:hypothetical protein